MKQKKRGSKLKIDTIVDSSDPNAEDHVAPLIRSLQNLKMEKVDLSTAESASSAIPVLDDLLERIGSFQRSAKALKDIMIEKRDYLEKKIN